MSITILICIVTLVVALLRVPIFESVFALILTTPVVAFLLAHLTKSEIAINHYLFSFAFLIGMMALLNIDKIKEGKWFSATKELPSIGVFLLIFYISHYYTQKWSDFIAIGERLRDFAILSSVIQSPLEVNEPWMSGWPLNYYAYWYRFGHYLSTILNLPTYEVYHLLQSFTFALYTAAAFRLFSTYLNLSRVFSLMFSLIISFGSNLSGIRYFIFGPAERETWWGPSRVIPGSIHEFPAWSFLLGDLHPHFLNLPLIPMFILLHLAFSKSVTTYLRLFISTLLATVTASLWIYNSNLWEVPIWLGGVVCFIIFWIIPKIQICIKNRNLSLPFTTKQFDWKVLVLLALFCILTSALMEAKKNITPMSYQIEWVKAPIERTKLLDLMSHFGIPLFIYAASLVFILNQKLVRVFSFLTLLVTLFTSNAMAFLFILLIMHALKLLSTYNIIGNNNLELSDNKLLIESLGISAIALVIIPEIVFLNDPYGSDIERMNTIFKVYSAAWFPLHVYAFYLLTTTIKSISLPEWMRSAKKLSLPFGYHYEPSFKNLTLLVSSLSFIIVSLGFFITVSEKDRPTRKDASRKLILPLSEGLNEIDLVFSGSAATIKALKELPKGIVLEAQGPPYSYTSHISTLSENEAFLGWANHVNLLSDNSPEVPRREKISELFYMDKDCSKKLKILTLEKISYAIVGPLEKQKYPNIRNEEYDCLKSVIINGDYTVYTP